MCLCERRKKPQRYSLFNFIPFPPRSTNRNMYDTVFLCCALYRQVLVQTTTYLLLLLSIFVLQTDSRESTKAKSLDPATQTLQNVFCCICASSSSHSPDWRGLMHLSYRCYTTWLLFISCFPVLSWLHASFVLLSKVEPNPTMLNKNRRCSHVRV